MIIKRALPWAACLRAAPLLIMGVLAGSPLAQGQSSGLNVTCDSGGNCPGTTVTTSASFLDASAVNPSGPSDICSKIAAALNATTAPAVVVDARGFSGASLTCPNATTPWSSGANKPATILLPAGIIQTSTTWVVPSGTRLVGTGRDSTILMASATLTDVVDLGASSCTVASTGVNMESLTVDGAGTATNGIVNVCAGSGSGVRNVRIKNVTGTGLIVGSSTNALANGSGPYVSVTFDDSTISSLSATCLTVIGLNFTMGFRGLTCSGSSLATRAIALSSNGNVLQDIAISGFQEGVGVGAMQPKTASGNIIQNVSQTAPSGSNAVVRIYAASGPGGVFAVNNLVLLNVQNNCQSSCHFTIEDETQPGAPITALTSVVAAYIIGDQIPGNTGNYALSRFQTDSGGGDVTNSAPAWFVAPLSASTPASSGCMAGSQLFNSTPPGASPNSWYVCNGSSSWLNIK